MHLLSSNIIAFITYSRPGKNLNLHTYRIEFKNHKQQNKWQKYISNKNSFTKFSVIGVKEETQKGFKSRNVPSPTELFEMTKRYLYIFIYMQCPINWKDEEKCNYKIQYNCILILPYF